VPTSFQESNEKRVWGGPGEVEKKGREFLGRVPGEKQDKIPAEKKRGEGGARARQPRKRGCVKPLKKEKGKYRERDDRGGRLYRVPRKMFYAGKKKRSQKGGSCINANAEKGKRGCWPPGRSGEENAAWGNTGVQKGGLSGKFEETEGWKTKEGGVAVRS